MHRYRKFALLLVRILRSQTKMFVIVTGHVFGAEVVFDSFELNGHHHHVTALDATGNLKERQLLIICEKIVELVHGNIEKFLGNLGRVVVVDG